jgi:hypothetical protein
MKLAFVTAPWLRPVVPDALSRLRGHTAPAGKAATTHPAESSRPHHISTSFHFEPPNYGFLREGLGPGGRRGGPPA